MVSHSYRSQNGTRVPNLDNCRDNLCSGQFVFGTIVGRDCRERGAQAPKRPRSAAQGGAE
jgi:hypothetical protein